VSPQQVYAICLAHGVHLGRKQLRGPEASIEAVHGLVQAHQEEILAFLDQCRSPDPFETAARNAEVRWQECVERWRLEKGIA